MSPQKKPRKPAETLSSNQKMAIEVMFWGPYDPSWKNEEGVIDNTDHAIAARLGLIHSAVACYTNKISRKHFRKLAKEKNEAKEPDPDTEVQEEI